MRTNENYPQSEAADDYTFEMFGMDADFDINAAFQEAVQGVASDTEMALEEKVRRMEIIVTEGTSDTYREFIDFRQMAAQMEMMCSHDHAMNESMSGNEMLSGFMNSNKEHAENIAHPKDEYEIDPKTGKKTKKKKRRGWFGVYV